MISGPRLFAEFALPPNSLGFCGPGDTALLPELLQAGVDAERELAHVAPAFVGAWPYLQLIGAGSKRDPLDPTVVEAYWIGNRLLDQPDLLDFGNSMHDRFRTRAGTDWNAIPASMERGVRPHHSFHVYCVYPWVGLLRTGAAEQALHVLDQCRIRWGQVATVGSEGITVWSRPLVWSHRRLGLGSKRLEKVKAPPQLVNVKVGEWMALHWDYACRRLTETQLRRLVDIDGHHRAVVNTEPTRLAGRIEN